MRDVASTEREADEMGVGTGERCERRTKRKKSRRGRLKRRAGCGGRPEEQVGEEWEGGGWAYIPRAGEVLTELPGRLVAPFHCTGSGYEGWMWTQDGRASVKRLLMLPQFAARGGWSSESVERRCGGRRGYHRRRQAPLSAIVRTTMPVSRAKSGRGSRLWRGSSRRGGGEGECHARAH